MNSTLHKMLGSMIVLALLIFTAEAAFMNVRLSSQITWLDTETDSEPEAWLDITPLTEPDEPEDSPDPEEPEFIDGDPLDPEEPEFIDGDPLDPEEPEFIDGEPDEPELSPFDEEPDPTEPEFF